MTFQEFDIALAQIRFNHEEGIYSLGEAKDRALALWRESKPFLIGEDRERAWQLYSTGKFYRDPNKGFATPIGITVAGILGFIYFRYYRNR